MWLCEALELYCASSDRKINVPKIIVETGAYRGEGITNYLNEKYFDEIHSIELSPQWFTYCKNKFSGHSQVHMHLGDSAKVLYELDLPNTPVIFYFDAHYSGGPTAGEDIYKGCPVLEELKFIANRNVKGDFIIIDDMRLMGKCSISGTQGCSVYPVTMFDFRHASIDKMFKVFSDRNVNVDSTMLPNSDRMLIFIC